MGEGALTQRRETAIVTNPESRSIGAPRGQRIEHRGELLVIAGEWLLDIGMFPRLQSFARVARVAVVACSDRNRVDIGVREDAGGFGCRLAKPISSSERLGVHAVRGTDGFEAKIWPAGKVRQDHRLRIVTSADHAKAHRRYPARCIKADRALLVLGRGVVSARVLEDDSNCRGQLAVGNLIEDAARRGKRESVCNERREVELALCQQIHERTHIAIRRPADVANRIILSASEIVRIKHAGAHCAAEPKIDFLAEPCAPVEIDLRIAYTYDAATITYELGGHVDWVVASRR